MQGKHERLQEFYFLSSHLVFLLLHEELLFPWEESATPLFVEYLVNHVMVISWFLGILVYH